MSFNRDGGTAQGDPLSPGNEGMGLQEALEMAQLEFPDRLASRQLFYLDDGTVVARIEDLAAFMGAPVCGTDDFVERHLGKIVSKAEAYVDRLQALLLPNHFEEYMQMIRTTLPGRFAHVCQAVVPRRVFEPASAFDALQLRAHAAGVGPHVSDDLPVREVVFLQPGAGGRGLRERGRVE